MQVTIRDEDAPVVPIRPARGDAIGRLKAELDTYYAELVALPSAEPGAAFQRLAGISARLVEIRAQLWRSNDRSANTLRSREVEPLLENLEFIFKALSRAQAVRQMEWDLSKGGM